MEPLNEGHFLGFFPEDSGVVYINIHKFHLVWGKTKCPLQGDVLLYILRDLFLVFISNRVPMYMGVFTQHCIFGGTVMPKNATLVMR